ncbi:ABC transporter substrate-binding protein [Enterovibrio nigricans]|uniref:Glycine betaine/proline transport system substrate-binding protein n=1 Tax=Enterovibrio nigricans DSM 22720 TaxID=1121868 RepID=A0A1T4VEZ3_9GAMM|nr:ABC transporter substrate-binding protein [Enterovibrio nigricans]PKF49836.1 ABC transporter substrate-binding protein [Enterovibrio nigricans]SKA63545.1 glycine betaine/proline transport system substrate-binding protein [Enterovibrio nigricans DSM 22720]
MLVRYFSLPLFALSPFVSAQECGDVTIADMNWNSATLMAHVDQFILENGYGCNAELVPGDTMPTGISMSEKGEPDIAPEFWSNSHKEMLEKGEREGKLRFAGKAFSEGGEEGFWVPKYMVDKHPALATIEGVKVNAHLFPHSEDDEKSSFMTCPSGWTCQITANHLFNALELDKAGFEQVDPGSGAALAGSIARAYDREKPWFGYYWSPTPVLGRYEMVKVDFGVAPDPAHYEQCITQANCSNPKVTAYPPSAVNTITTETFAQQSPNAYAFISNRSYSNADMSAMMAWMEENQADGEIAAFEFLESYPHVWTRWVPAQVAEKIKDAL